MSEQIREQVSAFLDGELPASETELLLKRLTRDGELRESFGRYALIGEALRGTNSDTLTRGFASRINLAIDGEPVVAQPPLSGSRTRRWWRPLAGASLAAGVAAIAIVALQQRAIDPARTAAALAAPGLPAGEDDAGYGAVSAREALSYTVPASVTQPAAIAPARLTNYVFAHSKYSSGLGQRGVLADLLIDDDELPGRAAAPAATDSRVAP